MTSTPTAAAATPGGSTIGSPETSKTPQSLNHNNNNNNNATSAIEFEPPLACVRRILKTALPNSTNVGKDASAAFCRASGIFVIYLTACANDFARENKRQTITANDVLAAVKVNL
jgi:histone H3/H4